MSFERTAKIIGRFDGKISGKGELQVAQSATCKADIDSAIANIDGTIEGNITAKDAVKLPANGKVKGDITATKMTMAEGASCYGMCAVGADAAKNAGGGGGLGGRPGARADRPHQPRPRCYPRVAKDWYWLVGGW